MQCENIVLFVLTLVQARGGRGIKRDATLARACMANVPNTHDDACPETQEAPMIGTPLMNTTALCCCDVVAGAQHTVLYCS